MAQGAFISYSHSDTEQVQLLVDIITKDLQFPAWYDHNLHGGDHYFSIIAERILGYEYFIFVVSRSSVASEFCTMELEFAKSEKRKILAVWLEDFMPPPRIRMVISHTHYIRAFALTREGLKQELRSALVAEQLSADVVTERPVSERLQEGYKYFLKQSEKDEIRNLLQQEAQGRYSVCFQPGSAVLLGMAYELGIHTEKDLLKAEFYYGVAAHKGDSNGEFLRLSLQMEQGKTDLPTAIERMNALAEEGCLLAMVYWGDEVYNGNYGVRVDKATAYRWWKKAAAMGHPEARYYVSYGYRTGDAGVKDPLIALMYAKEAEEDRFPRAFRIQGFLYRKGEFVEQNFETAIFYYRKAIEHGDMLSYNYLGDLEWDRKNEEAAVAYYHQAEEHCEAGRIKSGAPYYNLGFSYCKGRGAKKDVLRGIEYYFKGAERGHKSCKKWVAETIFEELETPRQKYPLLVRASRLDCRWAEYYLGKLLDEQEGLSWLDLGVEKGDVDCMRDVMQYYCFAGANKGYKDRAKALDVLRLFFSLWEENSKEVAEQSAVIINIAFYYYLYSVELLVDEKNHKPDKEMALHYIRKTLAEEKGVGFWDVYMRLALTMLEPGKPTSWLDYDPFFAASMEEVLFEHAHTYFEKCRTEQDCADNLKGMRAVELELEKHWRGRKGKFNTSKSSEKAIQCRQRAEYLDKLVKQLR